MATLAASAGASTAYVANSGSKSVSMINTQTNLASPTTIKVGIFPFAIAITPDGKTAYVCGNSGVEVIDTQTSLASPTTIRVGRGPEAIAITPDGKTAYVANAGDESVSVINTQTNTASPTTIPVGDEPTAIAITPDGKTAYVVNFSEGSVSVIDTQTNVASPTKIKVGVQPVAIAITPDGKTAYVANSAEGSVSVIDTQTNVASPTKIKVGVQPFAIAIAPDQAPRASFSVTRARPGVPAVFDASSSTDSDGTIVGDAWTFGDGQTQSASPRVQHTYSAPGTYQATLTLTDDEGCSTGPFRPGGQICSGLPALASQTQTVKVAYPGVRVRCPKSAKRGGCKIRLQAVSKKRKGKAESALASAKLKAGRSATVSLKPKAAFATKLAVAGKVLVRATLFSNGSKRTRFLGLKIVQ